MRLNEILCALIFTAGGLSGGCKEPATRTKALSLVLDSLEEATILASKELQQKQMILQAIRKDPTAGILSILETEPDSAIALLSAVSEGTYQGEYSAQGDGQKFIVTLSGTFPSSLRLIRKADTCSSLPGIAAIKMGRYDGKIRTIIYLNR